jgi:hypothetical protein
MRRRRARDLSPAPSPPVSALSLAPLLSGSGRRRRLPCSLYQRAGGEVEGAWQRSSDSLPLPIGARAAPPFASWSSATLRVAHASSNTGTAAPPWSIQAIRHGQAWLRQRPSSSTVDSSSVGADSTPHAPIRLHRHRFKLHWC